ncbi:hypothetical protein B0H67DRAFT_134334 [Lasiosphaeris hirsuta]|uniref:Uncharacterized protein n=1 Tax=Lasiosphaeris hirsuta TaxID=260670 RepID=A0AA40B0R6_9PEZI|nr:hypothetical protein B0H67DRAFT_134334 [Lasiosphaeris hirsuta]
MRDSGSARPATKMKSSMLHNSAGHGQGHPGHTKTLKITRHPPHAHSGGEPTRRRRACSDHSCRSHQQGAYRRRSCHIRRQEACTRRSYRSRRRGACTCRSCRSPCPCRRASSPRQNSRASSSSSSCPRASHPFRRPCSPRTWCTLGGPCRRSCSRRRSRSRGPRVGLRCPSLPRGPRRAPREREGGWRGGGWLASWFLGVLVCNWWLMVFAKIVWRR